jgi:hypothetical protein
MGGTEAAKPSRKARLARSVRLPLVSGKLSALVLVACFALTAVIFFPLARGIDPWIRFEVVLLLWWMIWLLTLTMLLYSGNRVSADHSWGAPRNWLARRKSSAAAAVPGQASGPEPTRSSGLDASELSGCVWWFPDLAFDFGEFGEGCLVAIAGLVLIAVGFFGVWLLIEILIPSLAFVAYLLIRGMLARVANDFHGCRGNLLRALRWASLWATVYTAPLALIVWLAHFVHYRPVAG